MSSSMPELPDHHPIPINAEGFGPETDSARVVKTVCWADDEEWPCTEMRESIENGEKL